MYLRLLLRREDRHRSLLLVVLLGLLMTLMITCEGEFYSVSQKNS